MPAMGLVENPVILPLSMGGGCIIILSAVKSGHSLYVLGKPADVVLLFNLSQSLVVLQLTLVRFQSLLSEFDALLSGFDGVLRVDDLALDVLLFGL